MPLNPTQSTFKGCYKSISAASINPSVSIYTGSEKKKTLLFLSCCSHRCVFNKEKTEKHIAYRLTAPKTVFTPKMSCQDKSVWSLLIKTHDTT